jgi:hypothetical protein
MASPPVGSTGNVSAVASPQQPVAAHDRQDMLPVHRSWKVAGVIAGIMVFLTLVGVALTTTSRSSAPPYWISLAPIFGVLCVGTAWFRHRHAAGLRREEVIRQILHWLAIAVALGLDFVVRNTGEETAKAAALNAMLLLALGCFLAGVHLEWHFAIVGVLLGLSMITVAKAEQYIWLTLVVVGLAVAALFGLSWLLRRGHHAAHSVPTLASSVPSKS